MIVANVSRREAICQTKHVFFDSFNRSTQFIYYEENRTVRLDYRLTSRFTVFHLIKKFEWGGKIRKQAFQRNYIFDIFYEPEFVLKISYLTGTRNVFSMSIESESILDRFRMKISMKIRLLTSFRFNLTLLKRKTENLDKRCLK